MYSESELLEYANGEWKHNHVFSIENTFVEYKLYWYQDYEMISVTSVGYSFLFKYT